MRKLIAFFDFAEEQMKRLMTMAVCAPAILVGASYQASADVIDAAFGNTLTMMMEGVETRFYFNENGSVSLANANGDSDVGTWSRDGGELCITWEAMDGGEAQCAALLQDNAAIGNTFSLASPDGASQEATLQKGKIPF
jgi:hypothetical protein